MLFAVCLHIPAWGNIEHLFIYDSNDSKEVVKVTFPPKCFATLNNKLSWHRNSLWSRHIISIIGRVWDHHNFVSRHCAIGVCSRERRWRWRRRCCKNIWMNDEPSGATRSNCIVNSKSCRKNAQQSRICQQRKRIKEQPTNNLIQWLFFLFLLQAISVRNI